MRLMRETPMPGFAKIAYKREPSFFDAQNVEGRSHTTIVGRDKLTGEIIGMGSCSFKQVYINGKESTIGYLNSLRLRDGYRNNTYLARGFQAFASMSNHNKNTLFLASVISSNKPASQMLTKERRYMPGMQKIGSFVNMAISMAHPPVLSNHPRAAIRPASISDISAIVEFLDTHGRKRQFFPLYKINDFNTETGLLKGLRPESILMAYVGDQLMGVCACWNQRSFRSHSINSYSRLVGRLRPIINLYAGVRKLPNLPPPDSEIECAYLSLVCIKDDDTAVFDEMLSEIIKRNRLAHKILIVGMHEADPLHKSSLLRYRHINYPSTLYGFTIGNGKQGDEMLDHRTPYLEIGSL
ncbi:hypothetical protein BVX97_04065 [bacterium E08(2017)]|nr:hypothetical protein BVX97_04065 [bacterium E08(2017)]